MSKQETMTTDQLNASLGKHKPFGDAPADKRTVIAIDPGPEQSAYVVFNGKPLKFGKVGNDAMGLVLVEACLCDGVTTLVIEQVSAMGMAVGAEVFETVFWSGRFSQAWDDMEGNWHRLKRYEIKMHLCGNMRAKDANIRQALLDKFGGKELAVGRKATPGPLYGISGDCWSALAIAVTWIETKDKKAA